MPKDGMPTHAELDRAFRTVAAANPKLPRRALGKTGAVLPLLGFGVSGPLATPLVSDDFVTRLVRGAVSLGFEAFDTAPFYGDGRAERRLGQTLSALTGRNLFITTKGGTLQTGDGLIKDFTPDGLRFQIEQSLLRLPHIDAFFLHGPSPQDLTSELIDALISLQARGMFRHLGVTGRGPELDAALRTGAFNMIMAPVHCNLTPDEIDRLEYARDLGLGIIGIESMAPAARGIRWSLRPSDMWYSARAIARKRHKNTISQADPLTPEDCLKWTMQSGLADVIMLTTTRPAHLISNAELAISSSF